MKRAAWAIILASAGLLAAGAPWNAAAADVTCEDEQAVAEAKAEWTKLVDAISIAELDRAIKALKSGETTSAECAAKFNQLLEQARSRKERMEKPGGGGGGPIFPEFL